MIRIKSDKIITGGAIIPGYLYFENGKIAEVSDVEHPVDKEYDMTGLYVSPGFIDMHTHGGAGYDFLGSADDIVSGCNFHLSHGTTSICPTISAAPIGVMEKAVIAVKSAMGSAELKSNIIGAHLEGPYLSRKQCGAQCTDFIVAPVKEDYERLVREYGDVIARWSYAPENDKNGEFCRFLNENRIVASAGHTDAIYDDMRVASDNGCKLVTHFYSCMSTVTREYGFRRLGVIESAYLDDSMLVEIIADGKHLPAELVKLILKIKGCDKVALVTDSLSVAGSGITHGFMLETKFIIEDGVCKLMDRSAFCGSIATADVLVRFMINEVGVSLADAVKMITKVPAFIMGLNKGELEAGYDADIIVFDDDISIRKAFVMGKEVM